MLPFYVTDFAGGSALYATVEDLARFGSRTFPAGRYRGLLRTCPTAETPAIDVKSPDEMAATLGTQGPRSLHDVSLTGGMLTGAFESLDERVYRLELRVAGDRLEGVVTRRTGLGPRANLAMTLRAELERER